MDCRGPAQDVSEGNDIRIWATNYSCDILAKHVTTFCPYPKNFPEVKLKNNELSFLAEAILGTAYH